MWIITIIMSVIALSFAYIIIDIGLSSIFAYFGIDASVLFTVMGLIIGFIKALSDGRWYIITTFFFGLLGYIIAVYKLDGFIIAVVLLVIYSWLYEKFEW